MYKVFLSTLISTALLGGCKTTEIIKLTGTKDPTKFVKVDEIIESVKCGIGTYLFSPYAADVKDSQKELFVIKNITAKLTLRDVGTLATTANAGLVVPVTGFTLGPNATLTNSQTGTNTTVFTLGFNQLEAQSPAEIATAKSELAKICAAKQTGTYLDGNTHPIANTLMHFRNTMIQIEPGYPKVESNSLVITGQLDISASQAGGFTLGFSILSTNSTVTNTAARRQILEITFDTSDSIATYRN